MLTPTQLDSLHATFTDIVDEAQEGTTSTDAAHLAAKLRNIAGLVAEAGRLLPE